MCDICGNSTPRTYSHSKNTHHKKQLFKLMKERKANGFYLSNNNMLSNIPLSKT